MFSTRSRVGNHLNVSFKMFGSVTTCSDDVGDKLRRKSKCEPGAFPWAVLSEWTRIQKQTNQEKRWREVVTSYFGRGELWSFFMSASVSHVGCCPVCVLVPPKIWGLLAERSRRCKASYKKKLNQLLRLSTRESGNVNFMGTFSKKVELLVHWDAEEVGVFTGETAAPPLSVCSTNLNIQSWNSMLANCCLSWPPGLRLSCCSADYRVTKTSTKIYYWGFFGGNEKTFFYPSFQKSCWMQDQDYCSSPLDDWVLFFGWTAPLNIFHTETRLPVVSSRSLWSGRVARCRIVSFVLGLTDWIHCLLHICHFSFVGN